MSMTGLMLYEDHLYQATKSNLQGIEGMLAAGWTIEEMIDYGFVERAMSRCQNPECDTQVATGVSATTATLINQIIERDAHGKLKCGKTLDRTDLSLVDWLQHQAEELMDGAGYALAAKRMAERAHDIEQAAWGVLRAEAAADNGGDKAAIRRRLAELRTTLNR